MISHYCFLYNCSILQKKALLHKTFFSLRRGSVTCMVFICFIFCLLKFLIDPDIGEIDGKEVVVNKVFIWL